MNLIIIGFVYQLLGKLYMAQRLAIAPPEPLYPLETATELDASFVQAAIKRSNGNFF
jgi:hypothetical protein